MVMVCTKSACTEWVSSKRISSTIAILVPVLVSVNLPLASHTSDGDTFGLAATTWALSVLRNVT